MVEEELSESGYVPSLAMGIEAPEKAVTESSPGMYPLVPSGTGDPGEAQ